MSDFEMYLVDKYYPENKRQLLLEKEKYYCQKTLDWVYNNSSCTNFVAERFEFMSMQLRKDILNNFKISVTMTVL